MAQNTKWTMNPTQKDFVNELKKYPEGITLFELGLAGKQFASGSINTLISKGIVKTEGDREFKCDVVYAGVVVGHNTKKGKIFKLVGVEATATANADEADAD